MGVEAPDARCVREFEQRCERFDERLVRNVIALVAPTGDDDGALTMGEPRKTRDETGLADAWLSGDEDDPLLAVPGFLPCMATGTNNNGVVTATSVRIGDTGFGGGFPGGAPPGGASTSSGN